MTFWGLCSLVVASVIVLVVGGLLKALGFRKLGNGIINSVPMARACNTGQSDLPAGAISGETVAQHTLAKGVCRHCGLSATYIVNFKAPCSAKK